METRRPRNQPPETPTPGAGVDRPHLEPDGENAIASAVLAATADIVFVIDGDGIVGYMSGATEEMLGYCAADWVGRSPIPLIHPDDRGHALARLADIWDSPDPGSDPLTMRVLHAAGHWTPVEAAGVRRIDAAGVRGIVVVLRDVSTRVATEAQLRKVNERLAHVESHDLVTQLPSRKPLIEYLNGLKEGPSLPVFIVLVRVCNGDEIRERYGLEEADGILRTIAWSLRAEVRPDDFVAVDRTSGFVVVPAPGTTRGQIDVLAERISHIGSQPLSTTRNPVEVALSVGVAQLAAEGSVENILDEAAIAGRWGCIEASNRPVHFDESMRTRIRTRRETAAAVAGALRHEELDLHYQPIVSLTTNKIESFEALLRWHHPTRGLLSAGAFIDAVESTALMIDIGEFVVRRAVRRLASLQQRFGAHAPAISVNVSIRQLREPQFSASTSRQLEQAGVSPEKLVIELTETHAVDQEDRALEQIAALRALGLRIALDDFGTGYSSLHQLQAIAAHILKIDRRFVEGLIHDAGAEAIIRAAIELARSFSMRSVAEGVETEAQRARLAELGCDSMQGFLVAAAVPGHEAEAMVAANEEALR